MQITHNVGKKYASVTGGNVDEFASDLLRLEDSDFEEIVLDFDGTEYVNSMAMGSIFALYQKLRQQQRKLRIINANDKFMRLLKMANLTAILGLDD